MFSLSSRRLRRRLSAPTSGSVRRRARERRKAQQTRADGERLARERHQQYLKDKFEQQKQARIELSSYEPWGRAGGGAPNPHGIRFGDLRAVGIYPEDELKGVSAHELCHRWSVRPRPTPVRLREDPQLCYADLLRQTVDNDIRYKQTPLQQQEYKQILVNQSQPRTRFVTARKLSTLRTIKTHTTDDMVNKRQNAVKEEMKQNLDYERKMQTMDGPWGKPGPGGTTWRNPRNIGLNFSKSMGWTDNEIFTKIRGDQKRCKKSLTLPKVKSADDDLKDEISNKENVPSTIAKLPKITKQPSQNNDSRRISYTNKDIKEIYGSEATRKQGKTKFVKRLSNGDRVKRMIPDNDIAGDEKKPTPEETILRITGGIELVPLLARRRRVGARTLPSSDVTRPPEQPCEWRELVDMDYLRELKHQMHVKCEKKEEKRLDSAESVRQHHATWASLWGRPGHGAPQRGRYARSNLAQLLYLPLGNKHRA